MAQKEKVDIKRSDQFQEMDDALTEAMAALDSTIDRVSAIFQADSGEQTDLELDAPDPAPDAAEDKKNEAPADRPAPPAERKSAE